MKRRNVILSILAVLAILLGYSLRYCGVEKYSPQVHKQRERQKTDNSNTPLPSHVVAKKHNPVAAMLAAYQTPVELYGKVIDQHGSAVAGASVLLLPFDNMGEDSRSKMTLTSDAKGLFSIKGLKGLAMGVQVTKAGYMTFPNLGFGNRTSERRLEYGLDGTGGKRFKDPANPVVFTLYQIGPLEPMFYMKETRWYLPLDGTVRSIALDSKKGKGPHQIECRFSSGWAQLPDVGASNYKRFDWSFEGRIPGGGFLTNTSDYHFEAPESGYQEKIEMHYSASMSATEWKRSEFRRYFVKFADGTYGRIRINLNGASDDGPLTMTSWINLKPGSRNLSSDQWDPTMVSD